MKRNDPIHQQPPKHDQPPTSGKPSWLLYIIGGIIVLMLLQKVGCGPVQTHEKMDWIDR